MIPFPNRRPASAIISRDIVRELLILGAAFLFVANAYGVTPSPSVKRVLLFYSSGLRTEFVGVQDEVIRERLSSLGQPVEVFSENLDPTLDANFYLRKYRDSHFDVIICEKSEALAFLLSHRAEIFRNTPVIFHALSRENGLLDHLGPGVTGVELDASLVPSLHLIRQLQPDISRVVVIAGVSPSEVRITESNQRQIARLSAEVPVDFWTGLTPNELRARLQSLPLHTAVLYMTVGQDREGRTLVSRNVLAEIAPTTTAPIYSILSTYLGLGTVGGTLIDPRTEANMTADLVQDILKGKSADALKPVMVPRRYVFDARELKRFHIPESRLPAGSEILFRDSSVWTRNLPYILLALLLVVFESVLVGLLLAARRRGKRSRQMLERRFAIEQVISDYSTRLSECTAEEVSAEITSGLQAILEAENIDRVTWFAISESGLEAHHLQTVHRAGVSPEPAFPHLEDLPWVARSLTRGEPFALNKLSDLPPEATADKLFLAQKSIKSAALLPSGSGTPAKTALALVCLSQERDWPHTLLERLSVLGNIFANASMRKQAQEAKGQSEQRFSYLFREAPFGLAIEDMNGQLLFANPALASMLGYSAEELCAMKCTEFADNEDEKDDWEHFQEMRAGLRQDYQIEKRYTRKDGARVWGRLNVSLLKGSGQWPPMVLATIEDITKRKANEQELQFVHGEVRHLTARLLQAQEEEKQRIARELHDDIGQRLSLLMMELDMLRTELPVDRISEHTKINDLLTQLDEIVTDVHGMSHQLHSAKLQHLGLSVALKEVCRQLSSQHQVVIELQADEVSRSLPAPVALCFYRVAQEALNNAAKHSHSHRIEVRLVNEGSKLRMLIRDFGTGFDTGAPTNGIGLVTMHERLRAIGGSLLVNSQPKGGTELIVEAQQSIAPTKAA